MTKEKELKLTIKQEAFARAYVETGNASEAYRRAYNAENMKQESIAVRACELLAHSKVSVMVQQLKDQAAAREVHGEFCEQVEAYAASELGVTFYDLPEG